ncbi:hypothetical protein ES708_22304 [subsurface metagenome]
MAKLAVLPEAAIISGFKGKLDFYLHDGVPCVRAWPRPPRRARAPAVQAQWPAFSYAAKEWSNLSPQVQEAYRQLATGSGLSGRDMQVRAYLSGLYRYPTP